MKNMCKWEKIIFICVILWQIPVIGWMVYFMEPNKTLLFGMPTMLTAFMILYFVQGLIFSIYFLRKLLKDPSGKGIDIKEARAKEVAQYE